MSYINRTDFWPNVIDEINSMHPLIALRTLEKFGFKIKNNVYDTVCCSNINKIQSVNEWLNDFFKDKFASSEYKDTITKNSNLLKYLDLISQYVNANPEIINYNFVGITEEKMRIRPENEYLRILGIPVHNMYQSSYNMHRLRNHLYNGYLSTLVRNGRGPFIVNKTGIYTPFGSNILGLNNMYLQGGAHEKLILAKYNTNSGSKLIEDIIKEIMQDMENKGKKLSNEDKDKINELIKKMQEIEDELYKIINYMEVYNDQIAISDKEEKTIKLKELEDLVTKYCKLQKCHLNHEEHLTRIIDAIEDIVNKKN